MRKSTLDERVACLGLVPGDLELLYGLRPEMARQAESLHDTLMSSLLTGPLREQLGRPAMKALIDSSYRDYLLSFSKRRFDESFEQSRFDLGARLEESGIAPSWLVRGYVLYFSLLVPIASTTYAHEPEKLARTIAALARRLALDVEIILEAYIGHRHEQYAYATSALAREGRQLQHDLVERAAELREAREQARIAGELASVGTLAAGLAHEIGTPMSVIQGHAKMLQSDSRSPNSTWRLQTIQDQIGRISRIMRTLLRIARPRRAEQRPVDLGPLIEETVEFVGDKLRRQSIQVKLDLVEGAEVRADGERLQQLFLNLFLNAADAMPEGGELRVDVCHVDDDVRIRVADTGSGIEDQHLDHLFEPFFTTKEAGHGNGLGLMVCKGIVADHGGSIDVESEAGIGTMFEILLPASPEADFAAADEASRPRRMSRSDSQSTENRPDAQPPRRGSHSQTH